MKYFDYVCYAVCVFGCFFHLIISIIHSVFQNKKIDKICQICNKTIDSHENSNHEFTPREVISSLSDDEVLILSNFVNFLRGKNDGE